jgi:hypothetical protein
MQYVVSAFRRTVFATTTSALIGRAASGITKVPGNWIKLEVSVLHRRPAERRPKGAVGLEIVDGQVQMSHHDASLSGSGQLRAKTRAASDTKTDRDAVRQTIRLVIVLHSPIHQLTNSPTHQFTSFRNQTYRCCSC